MRIHHLGSWAISRLSKLISCDGVWLEHLCRWSRRSKLRRSSDDTGRDLPRFGYVLGQGFNRGYGLGWPRVLICRVCRRRGDCYFLVREERFAAGPVEDEVGSSLCAPLNGRNAIQTE